MLTVRVVPFPGAPRMSKSPPRIIARSRLPPRPNGLEWTPSAPVIDDPGHRLAFLGQGRRPALCFGLSAPFIQPREVHLKAGQHLAEFIVDFPRHAGPLLLAPRLQMGGQRTEPFPRPDPLERAAAMVRQ